MGEGLYSSLRRIKPVDSTNLKEKFDMIEELDLYFEFVRDLDDEFLHLKLKNGENEKIANKVLIDARKLGLTSDHALTIDGSLIYEQTQTKKRKSKNIDLNTPK